MSIAYGILCVISLALIGVCLAVDRKKDICLLLLFISVFVCNLGQFLISVAPSLSFALNGNRIAYLGQVFLPLLMLKMILNLCSLNYKKWLLPTLSLISIAVLFVTLTPGFFPCYYKNVSIAVADGVTRLIRDYGPLHLLYYIYLLSYFALMLIVIIHSAVKKKITSTLHTTFLLCAVLCSIIIWFAEQFFPRGFEFLTVSYVISELFILLLYGILQEYGIRGENGSIIIANTSKKAEEYLAGTIHPGDCDDKTLFSEKDIEHILSSDEITYLVTEREKDVLAKLLTNKQRKEIAEELFVTESTIKKHTGSIFAKFNVTNRFELYAKLKKYI
ncbi:MAG: hypothetical protein IJW06_05455 [Clostridia bacterium]|nr:hypothetical protein [Clostridia bacterium]